MAAGCTHQDSSAAYRLAVVPCFEVQETLLAFGVLVLATLVGPFLETLACPCLGTLDVLGVVDLA